MRGEWQYLLDLGLKRYFESLKTLGVQNWSSAQCMKGVCSALREHTMLVKHATPEENMQRQEEVHSAYFVFTILP